MNYHFEIDTPLGTRGELLKIEFKVLITSSSPATNEAWAVATANGRFSTSTHIFTAVHDISILKLLIFQALKKVLVECNTRELI